MIVWMTGLPSAGKTTLAKEICRRLDDAGIPNVLLDADDVRRSLWPELGFSPKDRVENIRRIGRLAEISQATGAVSVVACISPFRRSRDEIQRRNKDFVEVFVDCPASVCKKRDVKGLYRKAAEGRLRGLTGVDAVYEAPRHPKVHVRTDLMTLSRCADAVMAKIAR
jgi:adenylylsulfate kinase